MTLYLSSALYRAITDAMPAQAQRHFARFPEIALAVDPGLDRDQAEIRDELGIECRRLSLAPAEEGDGDD